MLLNQMEQVDGDTAVSLRTQLSPLPASQHNSLYTLQTVAPTSTRAHAVIKESKSKIISKAKSTSTSHSIHCRDVNVADHTNGRCRAQTKTRNSGNSPSVIVQVLVTFKKYINGRAVIPHSNVT
jgi:hypothetical protein